ncbi:glycoside hydrolase family 88 protein [Melioribacter sp. Ez-97]|uniref:glycoside hydrolase family 88 protein n=1 Tax=Melioribacter sp. Ez-97 TaxID=3423434 RepID=UPI003EDB3A20
MKNYYGFKITGIISCLITAALLNVTKVNAQNPVDKNPVLEKMLLANEYFMKKWPDPGADIVTDKRRPSNIWTRATYYEGLMALYGIKPDKKFYDYAVQWAESHNWEPAYGGTTTRNADNQACGQTYIELYQIDPQPERIEKIKKVIDGMINSNKVDDWWWIDALHMAMPVFAKLGAIYNDTVYFNRMYRMYMHTKTEEGDSGLYNKIDHLWWRDKDFDPPHTSPNGEDTYWSRGNGWVLAALARVLDVMPYNAPHRDEYETTFKEMAEALIAVQREDGFWNVSLHDPGEFGGKETSGTAFFTFGLAWGVNKGLLTDPVYKEAAKKGWNALTNDALHENGFLGYVQSTGKQPSDGQPVTYDKAPNFEDYGLGAFLLAGSEIYKMAGGTTGVPPENKSSSVPAEFQLYQNYPNPFNPSTQINYTLPSASKINIKVYDLLGREITELVNEYKEAGYYTVVFDASNLSGGIYFYRITAQNKETALFTESKKMIVVK